jgi:hypothetical protein
MITNANMMDNLTTPFFSTKPESIELSRLPISKAARRLENQLTKYLVNFAHTIEETPQTNVSMLTLANDLKDNLRFYTQEIYWLGVVYVNAYAELRPKLTDRDLDNIKDISEKISDSVWRRINKFFVREKLIKDQEVAEELSKMLKQESKPRALKTIFNPKINEPLNLDKQFPGLATVLSTTALNIATIDKARQIREGIANGEIISQIKIAKGTLDKEMFDLINIPGIFNSIEWVLFVTAEDDRVCPICNSLANEAFLLSDPTIIIPVRDTHDNCRCRLLLIDPILQEEIEMSFKVFAA